MKSCRHNSSPQLSLSELSAPRRREAAVQPIIRRRSLELAYVLGAWVANAEVGTPPQRLLSFCSVEKRSLTPLTAILSRLTAERVSPRSIDISGAGAYRIRLSCPLLSAHIHSVTANNSQVPWEHLGSRQEIRAFLRGFFDNGGWVSTALSPGIGIRKVEGINLLEQVGLLCFNVGLYPLILDGKLPSLQFREHRDWLLFRDTVGFSRTSESASLRKLCARTPKKRAFTVEEYAQVSHMAANEKLPLSSIALRTGIPANTVRDWMLRGQVPRVVSRYQRLSEAAERFGDLSVIPLLYRRCGMSSEGARLCAKLFSFDDVQRAILERGHELTQAFGQDEKVIRVLTPFRTVKP